MMHFYCDIETYSGVDIKKAGLYKYAQSPDFEILMAAWALDNDPVHITEDPTAHGVEGSFLGWLTSEDVLVHAYNAVFEWYCLCQYMKRIGYPHDPEALLRRMRCTMAHGLYCGYPAGLSAIGEAIGLPQEKKKLGVGMSLIRTFCIPQKPSKANGGRTRTLPHHEPEKWNLFKRYCVQDVEAEREIERRLSPWPLPEREQHLWELDCMMNARGVKVDQQLVGGALSCGDTIQRELMKEAMAISGLQNPKSVQQLTKWLNEELEDELDEELPDLRKDTVSGLLAKGVSSDAATRMLEIRQQLGKTSTKKYDAMAAAVCEDERVRGLMQYYGANRTGRWAGRLVQVQNLPRNHMETLSYARELVRSRNLDMLRLMYGNVPDTLSQLIRTAFVPEPGKRYLIADFSAIEARVVAWLAGEQWRLDVFATHGKIYEASAEQMFHLPPGSVQKGSSERQKGKVAELALGYGGSSGALIAMGALDMGLTEDELPDIVGRWRAASPRIVALWHDLENAALEVMRTGQPLTVQWLLLQREMHPQTAQDFLTITLPVGRKLFYPHPFIAPGKFGNDALHYTGVEQGTKKWSIIPTFGGKLVENCLSGDALVITDAGLIPLRHVTKAHRVWDGGAWVTHDGLSAKGPQPILQIGALRMTPDHKILTVKGWVACGESKGLDWAPAVLPDDFTPGKNGSRGKTSLDCSLRLRKRIRVGRRRYTEERSSAEILRLLNKEIYQQEAADPRHEQTSGLWGLASNAGSLSVTLSSRLQKLWRPWDQSLRRLGREFQRLLDRHGAILPSGAGAGPYRQQSGLSTRQLSLDKPYPKCQEPENEYDNRYSARTDASFRILRKNRLKRNDGLVSDQSGLADRIIVRETGCSEPVYDLLNCGPRHQFAVWDNGRARIVSNCVQAIARDCLAEVLLRLNAAGYRTVFHVHDEAVVEHPADALPDILSMMAESIPWAPGLLLKGDGFVSDFYKKE
jgi:DNA polymerase